MKKFMKVCAVISVIMIVLGAALTCVAKVTRGSRAISELVRSVSGGIVDVRLGGLQDKKWGIFIGDSIGDIDIDDIDDIDDLDDIDDYFDDDRHDGSGREVLEGETDSIEGNISKLKVELSGCEFLTDISPDGMFHLGKKDMEKVRCYVENGELHVEAVEKIGWHETTGTLILYLPEGKYFDEVDIELGAGTVTLNDITSGEISLEVGAGQILTSNLQAGELDVSVGAGEADLDAMTVDVLDVEVGMGELTGSGSVGRRADIECGMGNVELKLAGSQQDFNYKIESAAGNLDLGKDSYSGLAQERRIDNGAGKNMAIECSMGNIKIEFEE